MVAQGNRGRRLAGRGIDAIAPQQGLQALEQLLPRQDDAQVAVVSANWQQLLLSFHTKREPALLSELASGKTELAASSSLEERGRDLTVEALSAMEPDQRQPLLISHLQKELSTVLGLEAVEVDPQESLSNLGLDSLMNLELKQRLENGLGIELPIESLMQDPSIMNLSALLLTLLETSSPQVK
jgi:acyl carrier protein